MLFYKVPKEARATKELQVKHQLFKAPKGRKANLETMVWTVLMEKKGYVDHLDLQVTLDLPEKKVSLPPAATASQFGTVAEKLFFVYHFSGVTSNNSK